jgi:hypothetical protein
LGACICNSEEITTLAGSGGEIGGEKSGRQARQWREWREWFLVEPSVAGETAGDGEEGEVG